MLSDIAQDELESVWQLVALQYLQHLPIRSSAFLWPKPRVLLQIQNDLARALLRSSDTEEHAAYGQIFLKALLEKLQAAIDDAQASGIDGSDELEIDEDLLERYTAALAGKAVPIGPPAASYSRYSFPGDTSHASQGSSHSLLLGWQDVIIEESGSFVSGGTTGLQTWEASLRLGEHLLAEADELLPPGTRILELGSGVGFLAALCAKVLPGGGSHVTATDVASSVLERLQETRERNCISPKTLSIHALDWQELLLTDSDAENLLRKTAPTLVLAADVVFDPELLPALAATIRIALHHGKSADSGSRSPKALVASTVRNESTYSSFLRALDAEHLVTRAITCSTKIALKLAAHLLDVSEASKDGATIAYRCFPSAHDPSRDGRVELLSIELP